MKPILSCLLALTLTPILAAQQSNQRVAPPRVVTRAQNQPKPTAELAENITISLEGNFQGLVPMDLQLTGTGPTFQTDIVAKDDEGDMPPSIITFRAQISPKAGGYKVEYSLGARIATKTSTFQHGTGKATNNYQFQDVTLSGSVQLKADKPVTLSKLNGKELTMTIGLAE